MNTKATLLKELRSRNGVGSFTNDDIVSLLGLKDHLQVPGTLEAINSNGRVFDSKYMNVAGTGDAAKWMLTLTERGKDWLRNLDDGNADSVPAALRELADDIERGSEARRALVVAFEDGTMLRLGCSRSIAGLALLRAANKAAEMP